MILFKFIKILLFTMAWMVAITTTAILARGSEPVIPNVLIILADDQGWGDLSINGNSNLTTPNIDGLARSGATFERFYVCPVCSPTRAEFLTGRYHPRGGVYSTSAGGERLDLDEMTLGDVFKAAGYTTAAFGKWHNGSQWPYHPNARGFDEFYGFCSGHWGNNFSPQLEHNGELVNGTGFIIDDLTEHAMRFMEQNHNKPFLCYLPYNTPHSPMQVPDRFYQKFDDTDLKNRHYQPEKEDLEHTRAALAMCENIDWNVGRLLKKLDELDIADETIVIYFSDNGPNGWRWNGGMKGKKGSTDEGGVRSPLFIRWPGKIRTGLRIPQIAGAIDLLPTLADIAGIPVASEKPFDGVRLKPLLLETSGNWPNRMIFHHWNDNTSVRTQQYRLDHTGALFDMETDPGQKQDISAEQPLETQKLRAAVAAWRKDVLDSTIRDNRPFPVGYREAPITFLPARDGIEHGNVQRSNRYPNCSFFTNWIDINDSITWDIEVVTAGHYEAVIYYTCPEHNIGATVQLRFAGYQIRGMVTEAYDPPLAGAEHDRVARIESYIKNFKPMKLGNLYLPDKKGLLTLTAVNIPGGQVMDVRYVVLTLLDK
jgi:arylsulfatase A-like enzyme